MTKRTLNATEQTPVWLNIVLGMWWVWFSIAVLFLVLGLGLYCQNTVSFGHETGMI